MGFILHGKRRLGSEKNKPKHLIRRGIYTYAPDYFYLKSQGLNIYLSLSYQLGSFSEPSQITIGEWLYKGYGLTYLTGKYIYPFTIEVYGQIRNGTKLEIRMQNLQPKNGRTK